MAIELLLKSNWTWNRTLSILRSHQRSMWCTSFYDTLGIYYKEPLWIFHEPNLNIQKYINDCMLFALTRCSIYSIHVMSWWDAALKHIHDSHVIWISAWKHFQASSWQGMSYCRGGLGVKTSRVRFERFFIYVPRKDPLLELWELTVECILERDIVSAIPFVLEDEFWDSCLTLYSVSSFCDWL